MYDNKTRHSFGIDIPIKYKVIKISMGVGYHLNLVNLVLDRIGVLEVLNIWLESVDESELNSKIHLIRSRETITVAEFHSKLLTVVNCFSLGYKNRWKSTLKNTDYIRSVTDNKILNKIWNFNYYSCTSVPLYYTYATHYILNQKFNCTFNIIMNLDFFEQFIIPTCLVITD